MTLTFDIFLVHWNHFVILKNRLLLKPMLGGVAGVAHSITGHEQTQMKELVIFISI